MHFPEICISAGSRTASGRPTIQAHVEHATTRNRHDLGAEKLVQSLTADLEQYIIAKVVEAAAKPLLAKIEDALSGLDWSKSGAVVGEPDGFSIDPEAVAQQVAVLRQQAVQIGQHGTQFAAKIRALDF